MSIHRPTSHHIIKEISIPMSGSSAREDNRWSDTGLKAADVAQWGSVCPLVRG